LREEFVIEQDKLIIGSQDRILITGSNGFIGSRVVEALLQRGFSNLRCFVRPSSDLKRLQAIIASAPQAQVELLQGNLLSREDCAKAAKDAAVILHLAAGIEKTFPVSWRPETYWMQRFLAAP
jgi:nucleoside-diphosphate-sugar epimerase